VKRSKAEARLNGEVLAAQAAEAKLKEKMEWYKLVATQITDMEKGRQEDKAKAVTAERQKAGLEEQVKDLRMQKAQVEAAVKEEEEKRVKAEEKLRKAEASRRQEKRLRLEEEKLRKVWISAPHLHIPVAGTVMAGCASQPDLNTTLEGN